MMKLGLMQSFFVTVDKDGRSPIADAIARRWLEPGADVRCVRASANFVCRVRALDQREYYLRFNHESERGADYIAAECAYVEHLRRMGIRAAKPVRSLTGSMVESVPTEAGIFHGVLFEALAGENREFSELTSTELGLWGKALGEIHLAGKGFAAEGRPGWNDHIEAAKRIIPRGEGLLHDEFDCIHDKLSSMPDNGENFGLIHFDFELDNIMWRNGEPAALDFDDCARYWYAADIANALRELFQERADRVDLEDPPLQAFVKGYRSVKDLEEKELSSLPLFLRLNNLCQYARIHRAVDGNPPLNEPEWVTGLRQKLRGKMDGYRDDFRLHPIRDLI